MPIISTTSKGSAPDASMRTEILKRQAIIAGQVAKSPVSFAVNQKPFIGQYHLTDGFSNGITEYRFMKGLNSVTRF